MAMIHRDDAHTGEHRILRGKLGVVNRVMAHAAEIAIGLGYPPQTWLVPKSVNAIRKARGIEGPQENMAVWFADAEAEWLIEVEEARIKRSLEKAAAAQAKADKVIEGLAVMHANRPVTAGSEIAGDERETVEAGARKRRK